MRSFVMVVEEAPQMHLEIGLTNQIRIPPFMLTDGKDFFVRVGPYASPGERYRYRRVRPAEIVQLGNVTMLELKK